MLCCFHGGKKSSVDFWGLGSFRFIALKCAFLSVGLASFDCTEAGNLNTILCLSPEEVLKKCHHASLQLYCTNTWSLLLWFSPWNVPPLRYLLVLDFLVPLLPTPGSQQLLCSLAPLNLTSSPTLTNLGCRPAARVPPTNLEASSIVGRS